MRLSQIKLKLGVFTVVVNIIFFYNTFTVRGQGNWSPTVESDVPEAVRKEVKEIYSNPSSVHWGMRYKGRNLVYHATGMNEGHHFSIRLDAQGGVIGHIKKIDHHQVPEPVMKNIKQVESQGWKIQHVYHKLHKNDNTYRVFFANDTGKHLKKIYDETGKETRSHTSKEKHGHHHILH